MPKLRAAMDAHFRACKHCTAVLEGTRNVIQLYGDERMIELPAGFGRQAGDEAGAECAGAQKHLVHVVGMAGSGGGDGFDCGRTALWRIR